MDAGQHIVNYHIGDRLHALGAVCLKINGANLIAQHNTLRFGARTAQKNCETGIAREIPALGDRRNNGKP
jgi:hypothetical protein